jgi:type I restriction enzyme S subunit
MTELGEIPVEWDVVPLNDFTDKMTSGGTPNRGKNEYYENGDICWIKTGELKDKDIFGTDEKITNIGLKFSSAKIYPVKTVLIAMYGATIGKLGILRVESSSNQACCAFISKKNDYIYLFYWLLYNRKNLISLGAGGGQPNISQEILRNVKIPLPPLPEQQKIASILSSVDETIEETEALIEKYQHVKKGLMSDLLTKGIDEEGCVRSEQTHEFKDSVLGKVPVEWDLRKLESVATLQRGYDLPIQVRNEGINPVYGSNGINGCHSESMVKGPGVLTGRSGTIGFVYYSHVDYWPLNTTLYVKDFHGNYPKFIWRLLQSLNLKKYSAATGVPSLNRNFIHPEIIKLPPLPEQKRIAEILTSADQHIEKEEAYRDKLLQMKKGLMQDLLTGRVRVTV